MFDKLSEKNIWVNPKAHDGGDGSFDKPFLRIQTALNAAAPGSVIALFPGIYDEKLVVRDVCASPEDPITIAAFNKDAQDVISHSEWYFYSVKDFVVKGIIFRKTINCAISLVGESERNSVKDCVFDECGEISQCAVFFGPSGGVGNVVENCGFCAPKKARNHIAVMISQSVNEQSQDEQNPQNALANSKNSSVRFCKFKDCKTAVLEGSDENVSSLFGGHEVLDNLFENCETGVKIKISATQIGGNIFRNVKNAVVNALGFENEIVENRFENCEKGVIVCCDDAAIGENCFIDSKISFENDAQAGENEQTQPAKTSPVLIYENTFVSSGQDGEIIDSSAGKMDVLLTKNIFYNCQIAGENIKAGDNFFTQNEIFADKINGDFSLNFDCDCGCQSGAQKRLEIEDIPQVDIAALFEKQEQEHGRTASGENPIHGKHKHLTQKIIEERDLFMKSMYFQDESPEDEEETAAQTQLASMPVGHKLLRPIGIDGELEDN